jgi:DNA-binding Lrp family transcriptional regulator
MIPVDRQREILNLLEEQGSVRIDALSDRFGVSAMTIHRDLDQLQMGGRLRKVRGGAVPPALLASNYACCACHRPHRSRIPMVLHFADETHRHACCPHCGLLALDQNRPAVSAALVTDFLYGRMINCRSATYVIEPQVHLCCSPTVLAFEHRDEAERFHRGFGGHVLNLVEALQFLRREMSLNEG